MATAAAIQENTPTGISLEELKTMLLTLFKDDSDFQEQIKETLNTKKEKKPRLPKLVVSEGDIPYSEMPYWKLRPDYVPPKDLEKYANSPETLKSVFKELHELWATMPPAEELVQQLTK